MTAIYCELPLFFGLSITRSPVLPVGSAPMHGPVTIRGTIMLEDLILGRRRWAETHLAAGGAEGGLPRRVCEGAGTAGHGPETAVR